MPKGRYYWDKEKDQYWRKIVVDGKPRVDFLHGGSWIMSYDGIPQGTDQIDPKEVAGLGDRRFDPNYVLKDGKVVPAS